MILLVVLGAYCIGGVLGLIAHEAGHWIVGRLLGFNVFRVVIGVGPVWYEGRLGETAIELRRYPTGGEVWHDLQPTRRLATLALNLGGVAGNLVLLGLVVLAGSGSGEPSLNAVTAGFATVQIVMICICLWPQLDGGQPTDGRQVISLLFDTWHGDERYPAMVQPYRRADDLPPSRRRSGLARASLRFADATDRAAAARDVLHELDRGQAPRAETLLAFEQLVTRQLLHGDAGVADRLDELSKRALDLAPDLATLGGSRGASLVVLGRYAEGKTLLAPLAEGPPSFDAILSLIFLARAEYGLGATAEARRHVEAARVALVACPSEDAQRLLERLEAEMTPATDRPGSQLALSMKDSLAETR